jgi:hypothetical protein
MNENKTEIERKNTAVLKLSDPAIAMSLQQLKTYMSAREKAGCEFDSVLQKVIEAMENAGITYFHASGKDITIQVLLDIMNRDSIRKNLDAAEYIDLDKLFSLGEEPLNE